MLNGIRVPRAGAGRPRTRPDCVGTGSSSGVERPRCAVGRRQGNPPRQDTRRQQVTREASDGKAGSDHGIWPLFDREAASRLPGYRMLGDPRRAPPSSGVGQSCRSTSHAQPLLPVCSPADLDPRSCAHAVPRRPSRPAGRMSSRQQPALRVADLRIRPFTTDDLDTIIAAYTDTAIQRWHARRLDTGDEARALITGWNQRWVEESAARRAVVDATSDRLLGQVGLRSIDLGEGEAEISYRVVPEARRRGVATHATRAVSEWALDDLALHRLELHHAMSNVDSPRWRSAGTEDLHRCRCPRRDRRRRTDPNVNLDGEPPEGSAAHGPRAHRTRRPDRHRGPVS